MFDKNRSYMAATTKWGITYFFTIWVTIKRICQRFFFKFNYLLNDFFTSFVLEDLSDRGELGEFMK